MTTKLASLLFMGATGLGCCIGIPIGNKVAPEKPERLTWAQFADRWSDAFDKIAEAVESTKGAEEEHKANQEKQLQFWNSERERIQEAFAPITRTWEQEKQQRKRERDQIRQNLKSLRSFCPVLKEQQCPDNILRELEQAANRAISGIEWMQTK